MNKGFTKLSGFTSALVTPQCFYAGYSAEKQKGFTLIELLVVVLIIGILAAVALPQYQKAVEKARWTEWFTTVNALKREAQMAFLETNDEDTFNDDYLLADKLSEAFNGGEWLVPSHYQTKNFKYYVYGDGPEQIYIDTYRINAPTDYDVNVELHFYPNGKFEIPCCIDKDTNPFQCQLLTSAFGEDVVTTCQ